MQPAPASIAPILGVWGYAQADPLVVGLLVLVISLLAVGYVIKQTLARRGETTRHAETTARPTSRGASSHHSGHHSGRRSGYRSGRRSGVARSRG